MNKYQKLVQQQFLNNEEAIIKQLEKVYGQSQKDINQKISNLTFHIGKLQEEYDWMDDNDPEKAKVKSMIQSKIYQKQYQEALKGQVDGILQDMHKNAYKTVSDYLDKCYEDGFIGTMFDLQGQGIPLCFPLDQEAMVRAVQIDSKISKGLYSHLGEDVAKLKKHITSEVSRGISSGMSFSQVAQQIKFKMTGTYDNPGGSLAYASRIARTEGHRIQVQGGMDACYKAKEKGADVVKQWDSTLDSSTRESHQQVDGEIRELDERFSNGLMFPGDPSGGAAEVVNCRCALLQRARWALGNGFTKHDNFSGELKQFNDTETYNEFKKAYFSKENKDFMKYVGELEDQYGTKDFQKLLSALDDDEYKRFVQLQDARPIFSGMYRGDSVVKSKKILENSVNSDIMKLPDIQIGKSVGAKANTYEVMDLATGEMFRFVEGSRLQNVEVFAGKGSRTAYRNAYKYAEKHGGKVEDWQHVKGEGWLETADGDTKAEVHWSQCEGVGKFDFFVKRWLE